MVLPCHHAGLPEQMRVKWGPAVTGKTGAFLGGSLRGRARHRSSGMMHT